VKLLLSKCKAWSKEINKFMGM